MKSNAIDPNVSSTPKDVSPTNVFKALSHPRRQHTLQYLCHKPGAVALGDLAEYIAIEEGTMTHERYERILTDLYHAHLPQLADAGLARYAADTETVTLEVEAETLTPYLELALPATSD